MLSSGATVSTDDYMITLEKYKTWVAKQSKELQEKDIWYCWNDDCSGIDYHSGDNSIFADDSVIIVPQIDFFLTKLSNNDKQKLSEIRTEINILNSNKIMVFIHIVGKVIGLIILLYTTMFLVLGLIDKADIVDKALLKILTLGQMEYTKNKEYLKNKEYSVKYIGDKDIIKTVVLGIIIGGLLFNCTILIKLIVSLYFILH